MWSLSCLDLLRGRLVIRLTRYMSYIYLFLVVLSMHYVFKYAQGRSVYIFLLKFINTL